MCGKSTERVQIKLPGLGRNDPWKWLPLLHETACSPGKCFEQICNRCKGFCVFSSLQNYLPPELFAAFAFILVNSGERENDLKPQSHKKSLQLYVPCFNTSVRLNMLYRQERACNSNGMSLSIIHRNMAYLLIFLPCEMTSLAGAINNGKSLKLCRKTRQNKLSCNNINTDKSHWLLFFL